MAPMFNGWCLDVNWGTPPEFVNNNKKKCHVKELKYGSEAGRTSYLDRFAHIISGIKINKNGKLKHNLELVPSMFSHLTSIDLENISFKNEVLLVLAPQLENLRLSKMLNSVFDISHATHDSFTKLKTLKLVDINIDLAKLLSKCFKTLEYLELSPLRSNLKNLEEELSSLGYLSVIIDSYSPKKPVINLLSKCSESLRTLKMDFNSDIMIDFSTLLEQLMKITTFEMVTHLTSLQIDIEGFLNKCPLIQKLTLHRYQMEVNDQHLKTII